MESRWRLTACQGPSATRPDAPKSGAGKKPGRSGRDDRLGRDEGQDARTELLRAQMTRAQDEGVFALKLGHGGQATVKGNAWGSWVGEEGFFASRTTRGMTDWSGDGERSAPEGRVD